MGSAACGGGVSSNLKEYIRALDRDKIGKVAVFSTSALSGKAFFQVRREWDARGIAVFEEDFYCRGQFLALHRGRPNEEDKKAARKYAADILSFAETGRS